MKDEILGRIWDADHEQFSADVAAGSAAAVVKARSLIGGIPVPLKAMAAVLAMSVTSLIFSTPAWADGQEIVVQAPSVEVSYADLNLGTAAGLAALRARVRGAANQLCQPDLAGIARERIERRNCFDDAVAGAQPQLEQALARRETRFAASRSITVAAR